jgi:hypothetical protein
MSTVITAGNATNGLSLSADNAGAFEFKTGTGAGTTALTLSSTQVATFAGTVAGATGILYPLVSGTSVTASGTSVDFTGIPSWVKRITVMFSVISTNGSSVPIIQLGSGSVETTGYTSGTGVIQATSASQSTTVTTGIALAVSGFLTSASTFTGAVTFSLIGSNAWVASGNITREGGGTTVYFTAGSKTTAATLDRVRITTVNGTDTYDAGTINILYE